MWFPVAGVVLDMFTWFRVASMVLEMLHAWFCVASLGSAFHVVS